MNKKSILFVGFINDYDLIDLELLRDDFNVETLDMSFFSLKFMRLCNKIKWLRFLSWTVKFIFLYKVHKVNTSKVLELTVFKDDYDYINFFNVYKTKRILILRNSRDHDFFNKYNIDTNICYSFDSKNCTQLGLCHYDQYTSVKYLMSRGYLSIGNSQEAIFLGKNKNREKLLSSIDAAISKYIDTNFRIIGDNEKNVFSYLEYLNFQLSGTIVLDIVKEDQSSETMRFLEGLVTGKKIITNNISVLNHGLYHPNNVLYFDSITSLRSNVGDFLLSPVYKYDDDEIIKYTSDYVLTKIINENL